MIDLTKESAVTLAEATKLPQLQRNGKRPHLASLFRWTTRGCRGVKLESAQVGGSRCTTREAVNRFLHELTHGTPAPTVDSDKDADAAEAELQAAGF